MSEPYAVDCTNPECPWTGLSSECEVSTHISEDLWCPECQKAVEPVGEAWGEGLRA